MIIGYATLLMRLSANEHKT